MDKEVYIQTYKIVLTWHIAIVEEVIDSKISAHKFKYNILSLLRFRNIKGGYKAQSGLERGIWVGGDGGEGDLRQDWEKKLSRRKKGKNKEEKDNKFV